ncbi:carbamoyltransferase [Candidatus Wolfebacteria bacterium]|nr:carbamoyltransferase [Candidatus Wolfebacteria bacterium]
MNILGINQVPNMISWQHDSAAALVKDGKIVATAEEERFNRLRHARGYPKLSVDYCLKEGGIKFKDVDVIAVAYDPLAFIKKGRINLYPTNLMKDIVNYIFFTLYLRGLKKQSGARVEYVGHHLSHAASTYRCSGFKEANVLTIDGSGETESFAFFEGKDGILKRIWDIPLGGMFTKKKWNSIGLVYTRVTGLLSMGVHGEGKTMGLASYGEPKYDFSTILNIQNHNNYKIDRRNIGKLYGHLARNRGEEITQDHKDLAASLQKALEDSVVNLAKEAYEKTGIRNFALAGGVALNCNTNSRLLEQDFCDDLFIQPAAHDGGIALGAAMEVSAMVGDNPDMTLIHAYWGPGFSNDEIEKVLKESKVNYKYHKNIEEITARYVTDGKMVGWFQGRMEMGPRALGNRTILADPTIKDIAAKVNVEIKHREVWRPFAPSVAEESATKFFKGVDKAKDSPYMLHTFYLQDDFRYTFPAITHVDGSSRIQTVRKEQNERYYNLLKEIEKINGYPMTLNTSFNDSGEPIVCTPRDALRCFFSTGFDILVMGNYLVIKNG